jgi:hypothetical protein
MAFIDKACTPPTLSETFARAHAISLPFSSFSLQPWNFITNLQPALGSVPCDPEDLCNKGLSSGKGEGVRLLQKRVPEKTLNLKEASLQGTLHSFFAKMSAGVTSRGDLA